MSSLPPEIITSILIRLPVKSLLRFRSVSKSWCSQIDGQDFIKLHLTHSVTTGSNHSSINLSKGTLYSLDFDSLNNLVKFETPFINLPRSSVYNTCNGLLLLGDQLKFPNLMLFNPSTRKHLLLPTLPPNDKYGDLTCYQGFIGLGYDIINDDYKVFNVLQLYDKSYKFINCEARIYSLRSNLWHIVKDLTEEKRFDFGFHAYVNGALHAIDYKDHRTIVALDVGKETSYLLPLPDFRKKPLPVASLHVFDGCLAFSCMYSDNRNDIWVMKEYGVKESWSMLFSVKSENDFFSMIPMIYSESRSEVLLRYGCMEHVWYDLRKKTFGDIEVCGSPTKFIAICVKSLVSVGGTGKIDEKKQYGEEK